MAAAMSQAAVVAVLIAHPAVDVNGLSADGMTPLIAATFAAEAEAAADTTRVLLSSTLTNVNAQVPGLQGTALHWASTRKPDVVAALLSDPRE